jgi:hypothetical protein
MALNMKFDPDIAKEIVNKYNLSQSVTRVWKNRGKIPDRYFNDYVIPELSKADKLLLERVISVIQHPGVNTAVFLDLAGVKKHTYFDALQGVVYLNSDEIKRLRSEIQKLKVSIVSAFSSFSPHKISKILNSPLIKYSPVIKKDSYLKYRIEHIRKGKVEVTEKDYNNIKDYYLTFALELSV